MLFAIQVIFRLRFPYTKILIQTNHCTEPTEMMLTKEAETFFLLQNERDVLD